METTTGCLLGGRVRYTQPRQGFRSGIEPVLLAAAVPARKGERVLEAGCGAGAGLLCLAARVAGVAGLGLELRPELAALAAANAAANGFAGLSFMAGDLANFRAEAAFDHAFANPPYHLAAGTLPPEANRADAKHADAGIFTRWSAALAAVLRPRGTLTLILPASLLPAAIVGLAAARCGSIAATPLWPREGVAAKLLLLQAVAGGRGPFLLGPGLVLHRPDGRYTDAAEGVLRSSDALACRAG